jgi:hypothetical protein
MRKGPSPGGSGCLSLVSTKRVTRSTKSGQSSANENTARCPSTASMTTAPEPISLSGSSQLLSINAFASMRRFIAKPGLCQQIGKLVRESSRAFLACYRSRRLWVEIPLTTGWAAFNVSFERGASGIESRFPVLRVLTRISFRAKSILSQCKVARSANRWPV